jgi:hypothetical protein
VAPPSSTPDHVVTTPWRRATLDGVIDAEIVSEQKFLA